jgi:hypothetical protein
MKEILRTAFTLGQQWVQDMNNDKEPINFNDWYNSDEVQQQLKILNLPDVVGRSEQLCACDNPEINDMRWACDKCGSDLDNRYKGA